MESYFYLQLNDKNDVIGMSILSGEVSSPDMIRVPEYDETLLGKRYENGAFFDVPEDPKIELQSELGQINSSLLQLRDMEYLDGISGTTAAKMTAFGSIGKEQLIQRRRELLELLNK